MRASDAEFRYRFWIIGAIFWVGFSIYWIDHRNVVERVIRGLHHSGYRFDRDLAAHLAFAVAALFGLGASLIRSWATAYIRTSIVQSPTIHSDVLVADGPYRHVRNPLYLGTCLLGIGMGFFASTPGFIVISVGILLFNYRLIFREEAELASAQSQQYRDYCARVPRLFPSLLPRVPAGSATPQWGQALLGESLFWIMTAAMVAFAVTLRSVWFYALLIASFPVSFALSAMVKRRAAKSAQNAS